MMYTSILAAVAAVTLLTGAAQAFTLTNEDDKTYDVDITVGQGSGSGDITVELVPGEMVEGICNEGCTVTLENGVELAFTGSETVTIKNGTFVQVE